MSCHTPGQLSRVTAARRPRQGRANGIYHLQIAVSDLERSLAFYTGLLGMEVAFGVGKLVFQEHTLRASVFLVAMGESRPPPQTGCCALP